MEKNITKEKNKYTENEINCFPKYAVLPENYENFQESINYRTESSKIYRIGEDRYKVCVAKDAIIHYKNDYKDKEEKWKEIDLRIVDNGDTFGINKAPYKITIWKDKIKYRYEPKKTGGVLEMELTHLGRKPVDVSKMRVDIIDNGIYWREASKGIGIKIVAKPNSVTILRRLRNPKTVKSATWKVKSDKINFNFKSEGWDDNDHTIQIKIKKLNENTYKEWWTGKVSRIKNKKTRIKDWDGKPKFPIFIS